LRSSVDSTFFNPYIGTPRQSIFRTALAMNFRIGSTTLALLQGDITQQDVDAIVNAANSSLMGGGGVDGAIHRAGGPQILEECKAYVAKHGRLPTGQAMITSAGNMKAKYVIHTVGPVWHGGAQKEDQLLADAYRNSLKLAVEKNVKSVAFPSISTGAYGFPIERAARIVFETVKRFVQEHPSLNEVRFVTFSKNDFDVYRQLFEQEEKKT
jgi:O-acetyl-ADP-ribose deacetylase (regulator of RNase III)